jgi:uncharacterized membrane protein YeaQ/YmgE (transglycosylase-associated protein family)
MEQVRAAAENIGGRASEAVKQGLNAEMILAWIVVGMVVGNLTGKLLTLRSSGFGWFLNLVVGGIGAFLGGSVVYVLHLDLGLPPISFSSESLILAIIFSIGIVLAWWRLMKVFRRKPATAGATAATAATGAPAAKPAEEAAKH